jgi:sugar lactone lactonase YvrE
MIIKIGILITLFTFIAITGCAPPMAEKKKIEMVWPLPPEEPRIKYVDYIASSLDIVKRGGIASAIFGEEKVDTFSKPYGVAVDKEGKIYVTDIGRVWVIDLKNKDYNFIGDEPGVGRLSNPIGVTTASDGRVFVTDVAIDRVYVYLNRKPVAAIGGTGEFEAASGIAVDEKNGLIYVVDTRKHIVNVYSLHDYKKLRTIGKRGHEKGEFNFPTNIAIDSEGKIYVVDTGNFRVQVFDKEGNFVRTYGQIGDVIGTFTRPKGIAIDSEDNIYVVDSAFQNIQIWDKDWRFLMPFGGEGTDPGYFSLPAGIAIDHEDKIYVVDQLNRRIQIFQYLSEKWKRLQSK